MKGENELLTLKPVILTMGLLILLANAPAATQDSSVRTADGDSVAPTIVVLCDSQSAPVQSHTTDADDTFSNATLSGAVAEALARTRVRPASHPGSPSPGLLARSSWRNLMAMANAAIH